MFRCDVTGECHPREWRVTGPKAGSRVCDDRAERGLGSRTESSERRRPEVARPPGAPRARKAVMLAHVGAPVLTEGQ